MAYLAASDGSDHVGRPDGVAAARAAIGSCRSHAPLRFGGPLGLSTWWWSGTERALQRLGTVVVRAPGWMGVALPDAYPKVVT